MAAPVYKRRRLTTFLIIVAAVITGLLMALYTAAELRDYLTLVVGTVASIALVQSWISSSAASKNLEIAQRNEDLRQHDWSIVLHPDGGSYVLRNTGTITATDVKLSVPGKRAGAAFLQHEGESGPTIRPKQSKGFHAHFPWTSGGTEIQVDWLPEGAKKRVIHNDVVQPTPDRIAEYEAKQRQKLDEEYAASRAADERYRAECRQLLIDLADAWGAYRVEATERNKLRVQAIVGALPTNFAREIGYAVDVPRDYWGDHQWPFENWVPDSSEDQELLRQNAPVIELIWNLRDVQIPVFVEPDRSQPPEPWPRIERAVYGFRDLVRQRESGSRELRKGERDRRSAARAKKAFAEMRAQRDPLLQKGDESPQAES